MLADGSIQSLSRRVNNELFQAVVGGYGLFGIILDVELTLMDNLAYLAWTNVESTTLVIISLTTILIIFVISCLLPLEFHHCPLLLSVCGIQVSPAPLHVSGHDILVVVKQIGRIITPLERGQPGIGCRWISLVDTLLPFVHEEVHVHPLGIG